ncbi:uncharacterized protein LOC109856421 isoform X2 [Pseudomyrmex gracilis]|uniref:uncharacterized protein LOC109856421 isoform X2 n=1 Tax=Pseudomyrmex gracilis TaxID=219809 RepID=UPI000995608E|nr:uncharacterized protein LOC109856421 isoform X2 [Pseudomyrmex gracilis]
MDSVERNTEEENETTATEVNQVLDSDEQQHTLDEYIREVHERDEYSDEECDEDYDELANMWHYDVATGEPCQRFSTLLKNLVTKYLTPVKRIYSSRPLEKSTLITTIFEQLKLLVCLKRKNYNTKKHKKMKQNQQKYRHIQSIWNHHHNCWEILHQRYPEICLQKHLQNTLEIRQEKALRQNYLVQNHLLRLLLNHGNNIECITIFI